MARLEVPSASRVRLVIEDAGAAYPLVIDPLITGFAGAQIESNQVGAGLGFSVAGAGDVNGDGYDDVIVGAPYYDAGNSNEGAAFVFLGSATGIANGGPATAAAQLESDHVSALLGTSVAGAGDVNGDGYDDVIVGAPQYNAGKAHAGAAFVFLGSATGIANGTPATAAARLGSNQVSALLGTSVAGAGDVNGDGYDDVIVGAPLYDAGQEDEGAAFVFLGSATGIASGSPAPAAARLESNQVDAYLGQSVAGAGDVNGDGYADVVVGARYYDAGEADEGAAFVFLGSATGIANGSPATAAARLESNQVAAEFGWSVAGAGDVNADGYDDLIVGSAGFFENAAFVFLGSATGVADGSPATAAARLESNQYASPWSVAGAGDVNDDGYADVVAGTRYYDTGEGSEGAAFVFLGSATGVADGSPATAAARLELHQYAGPGWNVAGAGDVNGDGYDDVIVGAYEYNGEEVQEGVAFVFLGGTCANGLDDDGDGLADYPADPGCQSAADLSERGAACDDGLDNDGDGLADFPADPGCDGLADASERDEVACDNGLDDDGDGRTDYPSDPGCTDPADNSELGTLACDNGLDDDGDGRTDYPSDHGCTDLVDTSELGTAACENGIDDDGDGFVDFPADPGCSDPGSGIEDPACSNGLDDDGDGLADYPNDPFCDGPADREEAVHYADGQTHEIAGSFPPHGESVFVEGSCVDIRGLPPCATQTELRLAEGGVIGKLTVDASFAEITGGTVEGDLITSGYLVQYGYFLVYGPAHVRLESGLIGGSLYATGPTTLELLGGVLAGDVHADSIPQFGDYPFSPQLEIAGTGIAGMLDLRGHAAATISGGVIAGDLEARDSASIVVTGGHLLGNLLALDVSVVEIHGAGFNRQTGNVTGSGGRITGTLEDGAAIDVGFLRAPGATIRLIPEPGVLAGSLAASLALWLCAHRRGRANARSASAGA
jgi:hypothetical protein